MIDKPDCFRRCCVDDRCAETEDDKVNKWKTEYFDQVSSSSSVAVSTESFGFDLHMENVLLISSAVYAFPDICNSILHLVVIDGYIAPISIVATLSVALND